MSEKKHFTRWSSWWLTSFNYTFYYSGAELFIISKIYFIISTSFMASIIDFISST